MYAVDGETVVRGHTAFWKNHGFNTFNTKALSTSMCERTKSLFWNKGHFTC